MLDLAPHAERVAALLKARKETVAICESSIGGLLSAALVAVPGASAYFLGGAVIYTRNAHKGLLAPPDGLPQGMRSATEPYALFNARLIRTRLGADWGLAETGASGPSGNRYGDPAGHACIAVVGATDEAVTVRTGSDDRAGNMVAFARAALDLLARRLE